MVIDSSVLIAILLAEPDAEYYANLLSEARDIYVSAVSVFESSMVIESKKGEEGAKHLRSAFRNYFSNYRCF